MAREVVPSSAIVERIRDVDREMDLARQRLSDLADIRALLAAELYVRHGSTEGARLLGINRNSLYRIVQRFLIGEGLEVDPQSRRKVREALTALVAGTTVGVAIAASKEPSGASRR